MVLLGLKPQMCIKPLEVDVFVSRPIKTSGSWEYSIVNNVVKAMRKFETATFLGELAVSKCLFITFYLDIGSNIGMYSVVVAAIKRQVVAVDADPVNLAYVRKSLDLSNNTQNVKIIYNSVRCSGIHIKPFES